MKEQTKYQIQHAILELMRRSSGLFLCFLLTSTFAQTQKKISTYFLVQYDKTLYDVTIGNNPSGAGLGFQTFFNNKSKFKPTIEFTGNVYLEDDKIQRVTPDQKPIDDVPAMANLFAGSSYHPIQNIYFSFLAGPSFINGNTFIGIKPSVGIFFSENQKWTGKISYLNIFNRYTPTRQDFGSVVFSVGVKLL